MLVTIETSKHIVFHTLTVDIARAAYERLEAKEGKLPPYPPDEYVIGVLEPKSFSRGALVHFGPQVLSGDQEVNRMDQKEADLDEEEDTTDGNEHLQISPANSIFLFYQAD